MAASSTSKYLPNQHVRDYPEIVTATNYKKLNSMWKQKLIKRENARALSELATELKVPNNEVRDSQKVLFQFMDELRLVLARAFILKEKCIKIGDTVLDGGARLKVMKIRKDFLIQLEGRAGGVSPQNVTIAQP